MGCGEDKKNTPTSRYDSLVVAVVKMDRCNSPTSHCDLLVVMVVDVGQGGCKLHVFCKFHAFCKFCPVPHDFECSGVPYNLKKRLVLFIVGSKTYMIS